MAGADRWRNGAAYNRDPIAGAHEEGILKRERYGLIGDLLRIPDSIKLLIMTDPWYCNMPLLNTYRDTDTLQGRDMHP